MRGVRRKLGFEPATFRELVEQLKTEHLNHWTNGNRMHSERLKSILYNKLV